jgi:ABC-type polysaccharide/polyol phosphate transport system ATPase subunit
LLGERRRFYQEFWALQDVSLDVHRGEALGIIGRNGSGKSTLLQLIAGTLGPTRGDVHIEGTIAALLELGSGFNPEFTGRENVFMNGAILGISRKRMSNIFARIEEFADIGEFINYPVKTYSSGMMVRLAFAVQACVEPDVLIVDEALSVGDVFFQQKCFDHVRSLLARGTTLLFVTHDAVAMQNVCDRAVMLDHGRVVFDGLPEEAVSRYYGAAPALEVADSHCADEVKSGGEQANVDATKLRAQILENNILPSAKSRHGAGAMKIVAASIVNDTGRQSLVVPCEGTITIRLLIRAEKRIAHPAVGIHLYDRMNNLIFAAGTPQLRVQIPPLKAGEERVVSFRLGLPVNPGEYTLTVGCSEPSSEGPNTGHIQDRHEGLGPIVVHARDSGVSPFYGAAKLPLEVAILN